MNALDRMNILASLRAGAAVELITDGGGVRYIETLKAAERWKVYSDLAQFFQERAKAVETEVQQ